MTAMTILKYKFQALWSQHLLKPILERRLYQLHLVPVSSGLSSVIFKSFRRLEAQAGVKSTYRQTVCSEPLSKESPISPSLFRKRMYSLR